MIDIKVPTVGESINEVTLLKWTKKDGEYVDRDEVIAELESEKATFEVNAEKAGILKTAVQEGDTLKIGDLLASIDESGVKPASKKTEAPVQKADVTPTNGQEKKQAEAAAQTPVQQPQADIKATPVASAIIADKKVDPK